MGQWVCVGARPAAPPADVGAGETALGAGGGFDFQVQMQPKTFFLGQVYNTTSFICYLRCLNSTSRSTFKLFTNPWARKTFGLL